MANRFLDRFMHGPRDTAQMPLGGTRSQAIQRLQIGFAGVIGMVMLLALADIIRVQADETAASTVPEAAATVAPQPTAAPPTDPMVEAGVVPDLPADPVETPAVAGQAQPNPATAPN